MSGDFMDFFRGFMGLGSRGFPRQGRGLQDDLEDDDFGFFSGSSGRGDTFGFGDHGNNDLPPFDDDDDHFHHRGGPSSPFGFRIFSGDPFDLHRYFEQQFDDMLKSFQSTFSGSFGDDLLALPDIQGPDNTPLRPPNEEHIRDQYLKRPNEPLGTQGGSKKDMDLDDKINRNNIGALFKSEPSIDHSVPSRSFGQSFSSKTIHLPDGRVEHHKVVKSSDGVESVTVTRQMGDQKYSVTTTTDSSGAVQKSEELVNIDQDKLPDFQNKWGSGSSLTAPEFGSSGPISRFLPALMDKWWR